MDRQKISKNHLIFLKKKKKKKSFQNGAWNNLLPKMAVQRNEYVVHMQRWGDNTDVWITVNEIQYADVYLSSWQEWSWVLIMHWEQSDQVPLPAERMLCCFLFFSSGEKRLQTTKNESVVNLNCLFQSPYIGRWTLLGREVAVSWQWKTRLCEAESLAVWVFWICVILSPCSGKLGNRCQRNLILEMGKKKKKELR